MTEMEERIKQAVKVYLPGREGKQIEDRGGQFRQIFRVTLDNDDRIAFKLRYD